MNDKNFYKIDYPVLGESLCCSEYPNGFKAYVIPKPGFSKVYASLGTHYGSVHNAFSVGKDGETVRVPDGIAHFLEHKLFEQEDENVLQKFASLGASPNAYTSFNKTVYLFSCTDNVDQCLDLLLDYVRKPWLTDENVEKEKGIIGQEIDMYQDNADWRVYFNLLKGLYSVNPVRVEIAGSKESIAAINKEILTTCHSTFYHPSNMVLVVVGDVDPEKVFEKAAATYGAIQGEALEIHRIFAEESRDVHSTLYEERMDVGLPKFMAGFKDFPETFTGNDAIQREIGMSVLLELILGKSSPLFERLYRAGLVNNTFGSEYTLEENYAYSYLGGDSKDPDKALAVILEEIERLKRDGLDKEAFARVLKATKGRHLQQLDSVEGVAHSFMNLCFKGMLIFDYFGLYDRISFEYVQELFVKHFDKNFLSVSKIIPV